MDGQTGMQTFRTAAQDDGVTGPQGQSGGVRRDIGAALIDDGDDADRRADAGYIEAVGPGPAGDFGADRIRDGGDGLQSLGHGLDPRGVQRKSVQFRSGQSAGGGLKVAIVRGQYLGLGYPKAPGHGGNGLGPRLRACSAHNGGGGAGGLSHGQHFSGERVGDRGVHQRRTKSLR